MRDNRKPYKSHQAVLPESNLRANSESTESQLSTIRLFCLKAISGPTGSQQTANSEPTECFAHKPSQSLFRDNKKPTESRQLGVNKQPTHSQQNVLPTNHLRAYLECRKPTESHQSVWANWESTDSQLRANSLSHLISAY